MATSGRGKTQARALPGLCDFGTYSAGGTQPDKASWQASQLVFTRVAIRKPRLADTPWAWAEWQATQAPLGGGCRSVHSVVYSTKW